MGIEYTEDMIDALYSVYDHATRETVGYHRDAFMQNPDGGLFRHRARILQSLIGEGAEAVLIVGMGLGCLNEALMEVRPELRIYGIDPAPYVTLRSNEMQADVRSLWLPISSLDEDAPGIMMERWGLDQFDVVISEDVLTSYTLDEAPEVLASIAQLSPARPIHWVSVAEKPRVDLVVNIRPLADWVALAPDHVWVGNNGEVVVP